MSLISALSDPVTAAANAVHGALSRLTSSAAKPKDAASTAPTTGPSSGGSSSTGVASPSDPLANESTFLTLLVSQLQNQDPMSPTDSNQFVTQLTQYSQLEQLIGIHKDTTSLNTTATSTTTAPGSTAASSTLGS